MPGGAIVPIDPEPFPRALWAPHAPLPLLVTILLLLTGVWSCYVFVVGQIISIGKDGVS
jgi:hypothetical protein